MISRPVLAVRVLLAAALALSAAGCDRQAEAVRQASQASPRQDAQEMPPLQVAESRWVSVADPAPYVDVAVDTAGITEAEGYRTVWIRQRLNRPLTVRNRTADTLIERRRIDCASERWGMLEFILVLDGTEISRGARPLKMLDADQTAKDRHILDLACAAAV